MITIPGWLLLTALFSAVAAGAGAGGLMGALAAERRLDRLQEWELRRPRVNPQELSDQADRRVDG